MAFEIDVIEDTFYTSWWIVHLEHLPVDPINIYADAALQGRKSRSSISYFYESLTS